MPSAPSTYLYLLGYPLTHSRSPEIHNPALQAAGLSTWRYDLLPTPPEALPQAVQRVRQPNCAGGNVTIPHKQAIIPLLDALTPTAQAIGAVNTLFKRNGRLWGDNTDAPGFWADLQRVFGHLPAGEALLLGAGGAARAVAYALVKHGWRLTIAARRLTQAETLVQAVHIWGGMGRAIPLNGEALGQMSATSLIVNCTPLGMHPRANASPWPPQVRLPQDACLYDLVYNPTETRLVQQARAAGLQAVTGLGMLHAQAALAFQRWVGNAYNEPD